MGLLRPRFHWTAFTTSFLHINFSQQPTYLPLGALPTPTLPDTALSLTARALSALIAGELARPSTHKSLSVANQMSKQPPPAIWRSLVTGRHWPQSHQEQTTFVWWQAVRRVSIKLHSWWQQAVSCWLFLRGNCTVVGGVWLFSFESKEMLHAKSPLSGG